MTTRSRTPLVLAIVLAVVAVVAIAAVVLSGGGDDDDGDDVLDGARRRPAATVAVAVDGVRRWRRSRAPGRRPGDRRRRPRRCPAVDYAGNAVDDRAGHRRSDDGRLPRPLVPALQRRDPGAAASGRSRATSPTDLQVVGVSTAVSAGPPELPAGRVARRQGLGRGRCSPTTPSRRRPAPTA